MHGISWRGEKILNKGMLLTILSFFVNADVNYAFKFVAKHMQGWLFSKYLTFTIFTEDCEALKFKLGAWKWVNKFCGQMFIWEILAVVFIAQLY